MCYKTGTMADIVYSAAYPKSGITYLNYMLFNALFDAPRDPARIDSDYIIDIHEHLARVPAPQTPTKRHYVKTHFAFEAALPLRERADRAVCLVRDPIDVMMSIWDFLHLLGDPTLLGASEEVKDQIFRSFAQRWVTTGGDQMAFAQSWVANVSSWMDQRAIPALFVRYESLKADPAAQLDRICAFLGERVSDDRIALAVQGSSVDAMRQQEQREIETKQSGAFYRPQLETGYQKGFRFVGRLNANSYDSVLTPDERAMADRVFGPVLARLATLT
jgi:hypothetical protein